MRGADMLMAFPTLLLALIIVTALGGTLTNEILAIGVALTPNFVRLARGLALTIREQDYILAARALGSGQLRVMARHVFPNALYALVVVATLVHRRRPFAPRRACPSSGSASRRRRRAGATSSARAASTSSAARGSRRSPGSPSWSAVLAFNLTGDALRDLLDPRLKGE